MQQRAKVLWGRFFSAFHNAEQPLVFVPRVQSLDRNCQYLTKALHSIKKHPFTFSTVFFALQEESFPTQIIFLKATASTQALPMKTVNHTLPVEMTLLQPLALFPASSASEDPAPEKKQSQRLGILRVESWSQAAGGPRSTRLKQHGRETYQSAVSLNNHGQVTESI